MKRDLWNQHDWIVIALILLAGLIPVLTVWGQKGQNVSVTKYGKEICSFSLEEDRTFTVEGEMALTVVSENGMIRVKDSFCPDHVCEGMGPIGKPGESIVCVPSGVIIRIGGDCEVDAVAQ